MANTDYIGKIIGVKIDRELGSKHPKHGFIYPVNYGFIPNTISGDGEEIDCYVLGVFEPIKDFTGKCIAVIHRINDNDDKLVIIPKDKNYSNTTDIDSTPNNKKEGEDDIDDAPVILSIKTGKVLPVEYISVIGGSIILLAGGAILIKKFVLM